MEKDLGERLDSSTQHGTSGVAVFNTVYFYSQVHGVLSDVKETGRRATGECTSQSAKLL